MGISGGGYVKGGWYVHRKVGMSREVGMSGSAYCQRVGISRGVYVHPQLLTPSGDHHIYGRQAGGTRPTRMLSCLKCV